MDVVPRVGLKPKCVSPSLTTNDNVDVSDPKSDVCPSAQVPEIGQAFPTIHVGIIE